MARKIASPKNTGGGGYNFEDEVTAWWMLNLLAGRTPLDSTMGPPIRLRWQARADGWLHDDLVADFAPGGGPVRAALSVKSGDVLKASRAPRDFVRDCWELHLNTQQTGFDPSRDRLVLVTSRLSKRQRDTVDDALRRALQQSPESLETRLREKSWCSQEVRTFIASFACPPDISGVHPVHGRKTGALLQAVRFQDFDFTRADASSRADALLLCRTVVEGGDEKASLGLWETLLVLVKELRATGGELTLQTLLNRLRGRVRLAHHPDHAPDWERMRKLTARWSEDTQDTIGDVHLRRERMRQRLQDALGAHRVSVLLGDSGGGKSVLLKTVVTAGELPGPAFCLSAEEVARLGERNASGAPSRPLEELVSTQPAQWALLALDRVERLSREQDFQAVARVLRALRLQEKESPWRLLLICQRAAWEGSRHGLSDHGVSLSSSFTLSLERFEDEEFRELGQRVPALGPILAREDLRPFTGNAKVLDLLARTVTEASLPEEKAWKGESSLIQWYWERYLRTGDRGPAACRLVERLARAQAEDRRFATPLSDLTDAEATPLDGLVRLGVLIERESTLRFTHDLHADYARQQYLLGQFRTGQFEPIRSRLGNPLWHRAIRLLALHLLEQPSRRGEPGLEEWSELLRFLEAEPLTGGIGADLLLEAIIFTARPGALLDELFTAPIAERETVLLRRFLVRFLYTATVPDAQYFNDAPKSVRAEVAARQRAPLPGLGQPTLEWIVRQWKRLHVHAPDELIRIATAWLVDGVRLRQLEHGVCQSLSAMVLSIAEWSRAQQGPPREGEHREWIYTLALLATQAERPRGIALIRQLAGRPGQHEAQTARDPVTSWPDGPQWPPDDDFRGAVLNLPGAVWLSALDPELASEISLALLLEHPRELRAHQNHHFVRVLDHADLLRPLNPEDPPYVLHPAWLLLQRHPEQGLKFVLGLVAFATARWREEHEEQSTREKPDHLTLTFQNEPRVYVGDQRVFGWHQDTASSKVLAAALMALEEWLYLGMEQEWLQAGDVDALLRSSDSVAILGVFTELALRHPELLEGPLEPLVDQPLLYQWTLSRQPIAALTPWPWSHEPGLRPIVARWRQMPHRSKDLLTAVTEVFARREWQWPAVDRLLVKWKEFPQSQSSPVLRDRLPDWLSANNWKIHRSSDGTAQLEFAHPQKMARREERLNKAASEQLRSLLSQVPMFEVATVRDLLDGQETLMEGELVQRLSSANSLPAERGDDTAIKRCGIATIAIIRHPEYLRAHPEWQQRCRAWLSEACTALPLALFDCGAKAADLFDDWTHFSARAIVRLWSEEPDAPDLRQCMVKLVGARLNDTVAWLFQELARYRAHAPRDFLRLLHLAVWFSRLRVIAHARPVTGEWKREVDAVFERLGESFVKGSLPLLHSDWAGIASEVPAELMTLAEAPPAGLHIHPLLAAWSWLYAEAPHQAMADRTFLIDSVAQLQQLMVASRYWAPASNLERTPDGSWTFSQPVTYLPKLSAWFTVHAEDSATRRRLWEPWLRLPEHREAWTAAFLECLYGEGLSADREAPFFRPALVELMDFALSAQASAALHRAEPLCQLLGGQDGVARERYWSAKQEPLALALGPRWKQWAGKAMAGPTSATAFLLLLQTPAARRLRVEALTWLAPLQTSFPPQELVGLLELVWNEHPVELGRHAIARAAFDSLLSVLVGQQNGRAIILSQRISRSP